MPPRREAGTRLPLLPIEFHPLPPEGFNVLTASPATLDRYKLPPRPDGRRSPELLAFWERMFAPPLAFIKPEPKVLPDVGHLLLQGNSAHATEASGLHFSRTRWGTSRNWSGAVITARDGMLFHRIVGSWKVPAPSRPTGIYASTKPPNGVWQASVWLGFDGYFQWSRSLPQLGTVSRATPQPNGTIKQETYFFGQWWVRDDPQNKEVQLGGVPVAPGDEVFCDISIHNNPASNLPTEVRMAMVNRTQYKSMSLSWHSDKRAPDLTAPIAVDAPAEGRTAAWCVERPLTLPTDPDPMQLFILPNLDSQPSIFQELLAEMRDPNNPANTVQRDLVGARLLRMVGGAPAAEPPRSVYLTSPTQAVYPASYGVQQLDR